MAQNLRADQALGESVTARPGREIRWGDFIIKKLKSLLANPYEVNSFYSIQSYLLYPKTASTKLRKLENQSRYLVICLHLILLTESGFFAYIRGILDATAFNQLSLAARDNVACFSWSLGVRTTLFSYSHLDFATGNVLYFP
ncbi:hypothetical protein CEXT_752941 [Caerostris extrusa]|uniref:Uncharacterized protein n=1 Tax=Caerostris extrusa TaxID=172846 RepID=A0AAV4TEK2_CAEEX|nr:hypothetical protein CEXT_752941 [Caerostris extrusa]